MPKPGAPRSDPSAEAVDASKDLEPDVSSSSDDTDSSEDSGDLEEQGNTGTRTNAELGAFDDDDNDDDDNSEVGATKLLASGAGSTDVTNGADADDEGDRMDVAENGKPTAVDDLEHQREKHAAAAKALKRKQRELEKAFEARSQPSSPMLPLATAPTRPLKRPKSAIGHTSDALVSLTISALDQIQTLVAAARPLEGVRDMPHLLLAAPSTPAYEPTVPADSFTFPSDPVMLTGSLGLH